jgi:NTE family protein
MYVNKLLSACKWKGMGMGFKGQEKKVTPVLPLMLLVPLFIIFSFLPAAAGTASQLSEEQRPKIGLVLSGGGARGAAHIGVIKVLEELQIPIDYIAGTSMGSIVGGLYASGMSSGELEEAVTGIDWQDAFKDLISREERSLRRKTDDYTYLVKNKPGLSDSLEIKLPPGFLQGEKIEILFKRLTLPVSLITDFDDFIIPFRAVATDIATGAPVVLGSGDLAMAMRASMSVPAAFAPVEIDGKILVDGGVGNNLPIDVARNMGADIIIAVDISTPLLKKDKLDSALKITQQLTGFLTRRNTEEQIATLSEKDVLIVPDLGDITTASFSRSGEAIPKGYQAANEQRQKLMALALPRQKFETYLAARQSKGDKRMPEPPVIEFVKLENNSRISDKMIMARLDLELGHPLDVEKLEKSIGEIYGLELFETIIYEIVEENGKTGLVLHVRERVWGPNYLQGGLQLSGTENQDNYYNFGLAYTRTAINRLGGEFRVGVQVGSRPGIFSEIYQPLDYDSRYFIHPKALWGKKNVNIYSAGGEKLAEYSVEQYGADLALGRELGTWGETRIGIRRLKGHAEVITGMPTLPDYDFDRGEAYLRFFVDKLDNINFPRAGYTGFLEYISSQEDLGADSSFDQVLFNSVIAKSWGRNTLLGGVRFYTTFEDEAPLQNLFPLGGFFNLSGYQVDELWGQHLGLMRLGFLRRISDFRFFPTYLGASLESGNVWLDDDDIDFGSLITAGSLFIGIDTILGPIYFAYGRAEGGRDSFYFYLGRMLN